MRISDWSSDVCSSDLAVERQRHLHPHDGGLGHTSGARAQDDHDRRDLFEGPPHGVEPWGKKGGPGRLIGRTKGGMNTTLHAVTDANGRTISFFMTAGQVRDSTRAAALPDSLPKAQTGRAACRERVCQDV